MRKHKSVVAILLAVMMIFTFMPTMAFATGNDNVDVKWGTDFKTATYKGADASVSWAFNSNGLTTATAKYDNKEVGHAYFYDFTGATLNVTNMSLTTYKGLNGSSALVTLVKPSTASGNATATVDSFTGWDVKYSTDQDMTESGNAEVKAKITLKPELDLTEMDGLTPEHPAYFGTIEAKTVKVTAGASVQTKFYDASDSKKKAVEYVYDKYDGKEHTLVVDPVTGYSVTYQKFSNGHWEDVKAVTYKNVEESVTYRAVYTQTALTTETKPANAQVTIALEPATGLKISWTKGNVKEESSRPGRSRYYYSLTEEEAANPIAFIEFDNGLAKTEKDVDVEEIKAVFNELCKIDVTKNAIDANQQTWKIAAITDDKAEFAKILKATMKAHKTFFANYDFGEDTINYNPVKVVVKENPVVADKDDDITFTGVTTKSFKAKKKTKKLAKNKSFQVAATAASGNAVTFTATSSNGKVSIDATGKVTVKKGLKKGAKVKLVVKAQTAAGNGYKAVSAEKTYTIKVK